MKKLKTLKALDLFCGAGGAALGLVRAGFDVTGIDIEDQPNYWMGDFEHGDVFDYDWSGYGLIWASPPCQHYSWSARRWSVTRQDLVAETRVYLRTAGAPYIIENVVGAPLIDPIYLEGQMFGLGVIRRRLFECSFEVKQPDRPKVYRTVKGEGYYATVSRPWGAQPQGKRLTGCQECSHGYRLDD